MNHPLAARRDKDVEATRQKAPPVPRAPRAPPRANSAGALCRDVWSRRPSSREAPCPAKPSEERRRHEESPFARISALTRERDAVENQVFEMGPLRRAISKDDFHRAHVLGQEVQKNDGVPWASRKDSDEPRVVARRQTLHRESQAADQGLEWVPEVARPAVPANGVGAADYSRINLLAREQAQASIETQALMKAKEPLSSGNHGRREVLKRESDATLNLPEPTGFEGGAPVYGRRRMVSQATAGHHSFAGA